MRHMFLGHFAFECRWIELLVQLYGLNYSLIFGNIFITLYLDVFFEPACIFLSQFLVGRHVSGWLTVNQTR